MPNRRRTLKMQRQQKNQSHQQRGQRRRPDKICRKENRVRKKCPAPSAQAAAFSPKCFFRMKKTGMQVSADKRQSRASAAIAEALL